MDETSCYLCDDGVDLSGLPPSTTYGWSTAPSGARALTSASPERGGRVHRAVCADHADLARHAEVLPEALHYLARHEPRAARDAGEVFRDALTGGMELDAHAIEDAPLSAYYEAREWLRDHEEPEENAHGRGL